MKPDAWNDVTLPHAQMSHRHRDHEEGHIPDRHEYIGM